MTKAQCEIFDTALEFLKKSLLKDTPAQEADRYVDAGLTLLKIVREPDSK